MPTLLRDIHRSFPIQLLLLHLRSNYLLLAMWLMIVLMLSGLLAQHLGAQYLFLDPEYLGESGYWAFLLLGLAFGLLTMSWNLSTYLLIGGYFNFLASLTRPFFKYCINNALLPLTVLVIYCGFIVRFYANTAGAGTQVQGLTGFLLGVVLSVFAYAIYFNLTNRDISYYTGHREAPPNQGPGGPLSLGYRPYRSTALGPKLVNLYDNPFRVMFYLNDQLQVRRVRSVAHYDSSVLRNIFRQNHTNALVLQLGSIAFLVILGLTSDLPLFKIPAGASFMIFFSLIMSVIAAISYWFTEWRMLLFVLILVVLNVLTSISFFQHGNQAYGLSYDSAAPYGPAAFEAIYHPDTVAADRARTEQILDHWLAKQPKEKPKMVIVCASGGGLTAALWATHLAQSVDECSEGRLLRSTTLFTGASGGALGLAYLREAHRREHDFHAGASARLERISEDLLNSVTFSIVSNDIFLPFRQVSIGDERYRRDRGYAFEQAFNEATQQWLNRPLSDYRAPEASAEIPLLFLTPSVVEDGRRMLISPQGVSYMMVPPTPSGTDYEFTPDIIDLRRLLAAQEADSLRMSSALRANASYPYVLPQVGLPTQPSVHLMDAGYRDNYGIVTAARFVNVFRDWILANTSGVILVQISAFREIEVKDRGQRGVVSSLFSPLGVAGSFLSLQILDQENTIAQLNRSLGPDHFQLFRFDYQSREEDPLRTSVSFHLTEYEKERVLRALDDPKQQAEIDALLRALY